MKIKKIYVQFWKDKGVSRRKSRELDFWYINDREAGVLSGYHIDVPNNLKLKRGEHAEIIVKL